MIWVIVPRTPKDYFTCFNTPPSFPSIQLITLHSFPYSSTESLTMAPVIPPGQQALLEAMMTQMMSAHKDQVILPFYMG